MSKILVLGGTLFLGRVVVEHLLRTTSHSITLFNRGKTNAELFPELRKLTGDRYETRDFDKVCAEDWDCIIDTSGYFPDAMERELRALAGRVGRIVFISTISVYDFEQIDGLITEDSPLLPCSAEEKRDPSTLRFGNLCKPTPQLYGKKKAECERLLRAQGQIDAVILRPAIIYGRHDFCERFYYWLYRVRTQSALLVPEAGVDRQNNTFVDDFAEIIRQAIDIEDHDHVYNVVTHDPRSLSEALDGIARVMGRSPRHVSAPAAFLATHGLGPNAEIPCLWDGQDVIADDRKLHRDFDTNFSSFEASMRETISYYEGLSSSRGGWIEGADGLRVAREAELIGLLEEQIRDAGRATDPRV